MGAAERSLLEARYQRLLREHGGAISRLASGYERIAGRREDLVQEIALAIWQALPRFRGDCSEKTFVYRIAQNRCLTHALRRKPGGNSLEGAAPPVDLRPGPESAALAADLKERLLAAIRALALPYRQVITLVLEEMSHAEIAEVLGLTENNVGVRLNRAREKLREILGATR
ncbi:MAG: RNA polymerase sigma factor [Acidobacteria bacterium]|nr:RNA polymerase sigma factor [Acidobacteriota bacterium]